MTSSAFPIHCVPDRYPFAVRGAYAIDGKIEFACATHVTFFLGHRNGAGYPRAIRYDYLFADLDGLSRAEFDGLALLRGGRRERLIQTNSKSSAIGNGDFSGRETSK